MAEIRTVEAARERHSRATAPRRRAPLEKAPMKKNFLAEAKRWMDDALMLRNTEPVKAARAAERALGFYLATEKNAFSERNKADCMVGAGTALSLAAALCERRDPRRASRLHEDAGDHFYAGARHSRKPKEEVKKLAREQYVRALELGGTVLVLERKIATCDRVCGPEE
ncbi:MAG: hypothetical protein NTY83_02615 [Candidatus Micrarchaeota archaeon]|nr:hypothetical protein [Candidatus Micrarchaeota archaeon]